jgi:predicted nucleotidyltransferase
MRSRQSQRQIILDTGRQHFGEGCEIWLFGSRVDDSRKGGDIDLMVFPPRNEKIPYSEKLAFRANLKRRIGDRKIDVLFASAEKSCEAMNDIIRKKWLSAVNECRTHLIRIHQALDRLANRFPLTRPAYDRLDEQDIASVCESSRFSVYQIAGHTWNKNIPLWPTNSW